MRSEPKYPYRASPGFAAIAENLRNRTPEETARQIEKETRYAARLFGIEGAPLSKPRPSAPAFLRNTWGIA